MLSWPFCSFEQAQAQVYITGRRQEELDKALQAIGAGVTAVQGDMFAARRREVSFWPEAAVRCAAAIRQQLGE